MENRNVNAEYDDLPLLHKSGQASLFEYTPGNALVLRADANYIPMDEFQKLFEEIREQVNKTGANKLVFDKRHLRVFHQPSMEWYFVHWKEQMYFRGLRVHRKILPNDPLFVQSVKIAREKLNHLYPQGKFQQMDIQYVQTLSEAFLS
ncbi:MAG: hypothetical protein HC913_02265 [Microscillaceae bacterium]|nr:hypothetical protein [Microscillaceae bacterium]